MVKDILSSHEERMKKTIEAAKHEFASLRAGRATPSLLDKVLVDYYGAPTPVNQVAKVTVPEPRMIMIQPWEKSILHDIEVAIMKSDLGLNPNSDGTAIRLTIPQLTQERRQELVKAVNKKAEEAKVALRNIRRDGNEDIKKLEKTKEITEDESKRGQESMQKLVDKYWPGLKVIPSMANGYTDATFLGAVGIPTYGIPGMWGDPDGNGAHGLNERMEVRSVYVGRDYMFDLVKAYADKP